MMSKSVIHSVFEQVAARQPDSTAVRGAAGELTYGELNEAANRLANRLLERHEVRPGSVVGLYMHAGVGYVVGLLGAAKAGAVFMPLDVDAPALRQKRLLAKARPAVVVTDAGHAASWDSLGSELPLLRLDELGGGPATNPPLTVTGDDACYIVFTSGSTGEPKAILGSQKGLSHFVHWELKEFGLDESVRVSQLAPPTFDVSLRDIFVPLIAGGTLCVPPPEVRHNSRHLLEWLDAEGVSLIHVVPSVFRGLLDELEAREGGRAPLAGLRLVLLAGEPLYGVDVQRWRALAGDRVELVNVYGPSETTLAKAFHRVRELPPEPGRMIPVGHPLPNTALLVIKDGELCDRGEIGEVYIKTPFMSHGYYGDPSATAEAFVQNPLNPGVPDLVYRTGDLGRYRADMSVELLGRQDNQVKVRGIRIELSEVERALLQHASVEQAVVVAHSTDDHQVYLVAYYIAARPVSDEEMRRHLGEWLPAPMHPSFFIQMEQFPLNLHGKVMRRALPRPADLLYRQHPYVAPDGAAEEALAELLGEVLELRKVGVTHSFGELGGDSLKAIRLLSRISQRFGVEVKLQELFPNATVRGLASLVAERAAAGSAADDGEADIPPPTSEEMRLLAE